jgi:hypothetical protein
VKRLTDAEKQERELRLPIWAQDELSRLRRELNAEQRRNAEFLRDIPHSNTAVREYTNPDWPLPDNARVVFNLAPDERRGGDLVAYIDQRGSLTLQGDRAILVHPQASNAARLTLRD